MSWMNFVSGRCHNSQSRAKSDQQIVTFFGELRLKKGGNCSTAVRNVAIAPRPFTCPTTSTGLARGGSKLWSVPYTLKRTHLGTGLRNIPANISWSNASTNVAAKGRASAPTTPSSDFGTTLTHLIRDKIPFYKLSEIF